MNEIAVDGPPGHVAQQVTGALAGARGESLLALDLPGLQAEVERLPTVVSARFDRAFPHTLRVIVVPERPVAVLRRGSTSWLVAASGRVIKPSTAARVRGCRGSGSARTSSRVSASRSAGRYATPFAPSPRSCARRCPPAWRASATSATS